MPSAAAHTAIVDATGAILVLYPPLDAAGAPVLPEGIDCHAVTLSEAEAAKLSQLGTHTVDADGVVTVTPPHAAQLQAEAAAQAFAVERDAAGADLHATLQAMTTRLDVIIASGGAFTATAVGTAVVDLARFQRRMLRRLAAW